MPRCKPYYWCNDEAWGCHGPCTNRMLWDSSPSSLWGMGLWGTRGVAPGSCPCHTPVSSNLRHTAGVKSNLSTPLPCPSTLGVSLSFSLQAVFGPCIAAAPSALLCPCRWPCLSLCRLRHLFSVVSSSPRPQSRKACAMIGRMRRRKACMQRMWTQQT